ncbi:uncharacterized protein G2W53_024840 [Senna tora]|uniref:Uncharacterized protein n=1 Tax=Senna tora TaxID=362788 RepID=A0A834TE07_9FABA|nr:uncharacterized protein G2W53_024840 [Senna tora]
MESLTVPPTKISKRENFQVDVEAKS